MDWVEQQYVDIAERSSILLTRESRSPINVQAPYEPPASMLETSMTPLDVVSTISPPPKRPAAVTVDEQPQPKKRQSKQKAQASNVIMMKQKDADTGTQYQYR